MRDPLTGLFNRRYIEQRMEEELSRLQRYGAALSILLFDIDNFKAVNDTHGHAVGDKILKQVATTFVDSVRQVDLVARFGGEEFGILLPHTPKDEMIFVCERIRRVVEEMHFSEMPKAGSVTISLGALSVGASRRPRLEDVYPVADELLYEAKQSGRNRVISGDYE